jgi:hypothetical protein
MPSVFEDVSRTPLLGLTRHVDKSLSVIQAERDPIAPFLGLILEQTREGHRIMGAYRSIGTQVNTRPPRRSMG